MLGFRAEKGDNIATLEKQLGLPAGAIVNGINPVDKAILEKTNVGDIITLQNLEVVRNINTYLNRTDIDETNCSNCALFVNGINQANAWLGTGYEEMEEASEILKQNFINIDSKNSSIGNIVTFVEEDWEESAKLNASMEYSVGSASGRINSTEINKDQFINQQLDMYKESKRPDHYGIVILKSKNGEQIQQILEKPGINNVRVTDYNNYDSFKKQGARKDPSNIYRKND